MKTDDITTLQSYIIECNLKRKKRQVYIKCHNNNEGKEVANILSLYKSELLKNPDGWKKIREGLGYKDFTIIFRLQNDSAEFYDNLKNILEGKVEPSDKNEIEQTKQEMEEQRKSSSRSLVFIVVLILLAAIGFYVWQTGK